MMLSSSSRRLQAVLPRRSLLLGAAGLSVMATTLAACSSGAGPTLYTLSVVPGQPAPGGPRFVEVRQPTIASGLDRDRIVTADSGYKLTVSPNDAWGDSLAGQISRALAGDLAQRLPGTSVFAENDAVSTEPQAYVELSVTRFSAGPSGAVQIEAMLSVKGAQAGAPDTSGQFFMQRVLVQAPGVSSGTIGMVQTLSQLLGQLADQAATQLRMMPPVPPQDSMPQTPAAASGQHHRK